MPADDGILAVAHCAQPSVKFNAWQRNLHVARLIDCPESHKFTAGNPVRRTTGEILFGYQFGFIRVLGRNVPGGDRGAFRSRGAMATDTGLESLTDQLPAPTAQPSAQPSVAPFYDPIDDDQNEEWALKQRQGRKSDAVLTCPACLTTLCIDCQRHELYVNQYRAMFVRNCTIVETERLRYSDNRKRKRNARRKRRPQEEDSAVGGPGMIRIDPKDVGVDEEVFKPVRCAECGAEVAVLDSDEVYHFFDAIPTFS